MTPGADEKGHFLPITTSYDYDAPISEAGDPTPKLFALRNVISQVPYHFIKRQRLLLISGKGVSNLYVKGSQKSVVVVWAREHFEHPVEVFSTHPNKTTWGDTQKYVQNYRIFMTPEALPWTLGLELCARVLE